MVRILAAALTILAVPAAAQSDLSDVEIRTTKVADGLYMLEGAGGNIGLSVGEDGAFVIDDQFAPLSEKIMAAIAAVTDKPVEFVLNTHYHNDHTGGNEPFGKSGAHLVAHENVRERLAAATAETPKDALPVITFSENVSFFWNGDEIRVKHKGAAHTDGDAIIRFMSANVVHLGDVMFAGRYPYIDLDGGGDLDGYIATLEYVAGAIDAGTKVIPGHGPLSDMEDVKASLAMLKDVRARVQALIDDGLDEEAVVAADPLADLNDRWAWEFIDGERMTRTAYRALTAE